jgi:hypothetical protein
MDVDETADRIKFLIRDRDFLYPPELEHTLSGAGIETVRSAAPRPTPATRSRRPRRLPRSKTGPGWRRDPRISVGRLTFTDGIIGKPNRPHVHCSEPRKQQKQSLHITHPQHPATDPEGAGKSVRAGHGLAEPWA